MRLAFVLEYYGDCRAAIDFFAKTFDKAEVTYKTFREMPSAELLGISGEALDLVWQGSVRIPYGDMILNLNVSDSVLTAMQNNVGTSSPFFRPTICICGDSQAAKIEEGERHYINWEYSEKGCDGIYYRLSFDGFCRDVIAFYEKVFRLKAEHIIRYGETDLRDKVSDAGKEMISSATLLFPENCGGCGIMLQDSYDSAVSGVNSYNKDALLFYHRIYNPVFEIREVNQETLRTMFHTISDGAKLNRPLGTDDKGVLYGSLIDRYGICWNFYADGQ